MLTLEDERLLIVRRKYLAVKAEWNMENVVELEVERTIGPGGSDKT